MFNLLPSEVLSLIGNHLCYVDLMALRFSCSTFYYHLNPPDIATLVKRELSKYIDREDEFLELLCVKKAVLAGSFMVKVLYDAKWEPGDIDVFEHPEQEKCFSPLDPVTDYDFLLDLCGEETEEEDLQSKVTLLQRTFHDCLESLSMIKIVRDVWKHKSNKTDKKINYIPPLCNNVSPMRRIYETFDNDIVKIAYYQNKLYVKDWKKLFARKSYSVPSYVMWLGCYYEIASRMTEDLEEKALKEMGLRNKKYTERGFTLVQHPQTLPIIQESVKYSAGEEVNADCREGRDKNYAYLFTLLDFNKYLDESMD